MKYKKIDYRKILITLIKDKRLISAIKRKYLQISKMKRKTTKRKKNGCKMPMAHQHAVTLPSADVCPLTMFHSS